MNTKRWFVVLALTLGLLGVGAPGSSAAAGAPARITFLAASCPASSSMYSRVASGQDPNSNENGTAAAPADIAAYGCSASGRPGFFLLANSTSGSLFLDEALTQAMVVSSVETGAAGGATIVQAGSTVYTPGDTAQTRRLSVSNYPTTITARAAMPFLDLQCGTDGINGDNADGIGWGNQSLAAGSQHYCIAYVWDGVGAATATPAGTSSPTATVSATAIPTATPTRSSATATGTAEPTKPVSVRKTFVAETVGHVSWKLAPSSPAKLDVWDAAAVKCEAFGGADCGDITSGGAGSFKQGNGNGEQYLLVYQPLTKDGESCKVTNTAEWAENDAAKRSSVTAAYECSGAPTMGWGLFALFATGAAGLAWVVQRKLSWSR